MNRFDEIIPNLSPEDLARQVAVAQVTDALMVAQSAQANGIQSEPSANGGFSGNLAPVSGVDPHITQVVDAIEARNREPGAEPFVVSGGEASTRPLTPEEQQVADALTNVQMRQAAQSSFLPNPHSNYDANGQYHRPANQPNPPGNEPPNEDYTGYILPYHYDSQTGDYSPAVPRIVTDMGQEIASAVTLPGDVYSGKYALPNLSEPGISEDDGGNVYRNGEYLGNRFLNQQETERRAFGMATMLAGGGPLNQAGQQGTRAIHRGYYTGRVRRQLESNNPQTTSIGRIDRNLLNEINRIREIEGVPKIGTRNVNIYDSVFRKFQEGRIGEEGLTPQRVAEIAYRLVHGNGTTAERAGYPTSARLVNRDGRDVAAGYVGRYKADDVSLKNVIPTKQRGLEEMRPGDERKRLERLMRGGNSIP